MMMMIIIIIIITIIIIIIITIIIIIITIIIIIIIISINAKMRHYSTVARPKVLYGEECLTLNKKLMMNLQSPEEEYKNILLRTKSIQNKT